MVRTNLSCRLRCDHRDCARVESPEVVKAAPRAIAEAVRGGAGRLHLVGGEPLLRRDLERLVAFARHSAGTSELNIEVETHAIGLRPDRARALRDAGVDALRVEVPALGPAFDTLVAQPGAAEAQLAGLRAAQSAGLAWELILPVLATNLETLHEVPAALGTLGVSPRSVLIRVPLQSVVSPDSEAPTAAYGPQIGAAIACVERCDRGARELELRPRLDPGTLLPPCWFSRPAQVGHLYTLTPGGRDRPGWRRVEACAGCKVSDRCVGMPESTLALEPALAPRPITADRVRRRLSLMQGVDEQIARELVSLDLGRDATGETWRVHTVRVNFLCNQACDFCFVSTHLPFPEVQAVREAIATCGREGAWLALSGGEPTLNPRLADYARFAKAQGVAGIELQTNAIRLADDALCGTLLDAGVDVVFVSLHGSRAEVCDRVTNAPGTWAKTIAGLDNLHRRGARVRTNFVICSLNADDFVDVVELVATRWPGFDLTFSFVAPSTDLVPRTKALIPRYSDMAEPMRLGFARARELELEVTGFESMCAIPHCLKPDGLESYAGLSPVEAGLERGEFLKPPICADCSQRDQCWGIRRGYVDLHGDAELRPFS